MVLKLISEPAAHNEFEGRTFEAFSNSLSGISLGPLKAETGVRFP